MPESHQVWTTVPLGDLFSKLVNGGTPSTNVPMFWDGNTPWVTGADFTQRGIGEIRRYVSEKGIRSSATSVVDAGNLLVVTRTGVGKLAIAREDIAISQDITGVYVDQSKATTRFVYHLLRSEVERLKKLNQGTSINGIVRSDLERHQVNIPIDLAVQDKIVRVLDETDQAIEKTEALIEKYQQIKAGLMHDLFTRGIGADGKLRPPREQAPEMYQETPIGWIPKDWAFGPFARYVDVHNQLRLPLAAEVRSAMRGTYPYYGPTGIVDFIDHYRVDGKYCLLGEDGDHFLKFESRRMTQLVDGQFNVNNHAHILSGKDGCSTDWIYYFYMHRDITFWLTRQGAGRYKLNKATLEKLPIAVPPPGEQSIISDRIVATESRLVSEAKELDKLTKVKAGLMHDLLSGHVEVAHV